MGNKAKFNEEWESKLVAMDSDETALSADRKAKAEQDLDAFYDELTDKKAHRQAANREREAETIATIDQLNGNDNSFEKVISLIDMSDNTDENTERMRSMLIQLKNEKKDS